MISNTRDEALIIESSPLNAKGTEDKSFVLYFRRICCICKCLAGIRNIRNGYKYIICLERIKLMEITFVKCLFFISFQPWDAFKIEKYISGYCPKVF